MSKAATLAGNAVQKGFNAATKAAEGFLDERAAAQQNLTQMSRQMQSHPEHMQLSGAGGSQQTQQLQPEQQTTVHYNPAEHHIIDQLDRFALDFAAKSYLMQTGGAFFYALNLHNQPGFIGFQPKSAFIDDIQHITKTLENPSEQAISGKKNALQKMLSIPKTPKKELIGLNASLVITDVKDFSKLRGSKTASCREVRIPIKVIFFKNLSKADMDGIKSIFSNYAIDAFNPNTHAYINVSGQYASIAQLDTKKIPHYQQQPLSSSEEWAKFGTQLKHVGKFSAAVLAPPLAASAVLGKSIRMLLGEPWW